MKLVQYCCRLGPALVHQTPLNQLQHPQAVKWWGGHMLVLPCTPHSSPSQSPAAPGDCSAPFHQAREPLVLSETDMGFLDMVGGAEIASNMSRMGPWSMASPTLALKKCQKQGGRLSARPQRTKRQAVVRRSKISKLGTCKLETASKRPGT